MVPYNKYVLLRVLAWHNWCEHGARRVGGERFGLCVRFTCKDEAAAEGYDQLVAETIEAIKANEPGTLVYASHTVEGQPLQRIFYELYRDRAAFEAHEASPHTRRYLEARDQYLASTEVDWLTLQTGKGTGG